MVQDKVISLGTPGIPTADFLAARARRVGQPIRLKSILAIQLNLRAAARFSGKTEEALHAALGDAARTVADMPATCMTFPGTSNPVMRADRAPVGRAPEALLIDEAYLRRFGELQIPTRLWRALSRHDAWIEPALISEWVLLIRSYAERQGHVLDPSVVARAMEWSEPSRSVSFARGSRSICASEAICGASGPVEG